MLDFILWSVEKKSVFLEKLLMVPGAPSCGGAKSTGPAPDSTLPASAVRKQRE